MLPTAKTELEWTSRKEKRFLDRAVDGYRVVEIPSQEAIYRDE